MTKKKERRTIDECMRIHYSKDGKKTKSKTPVRVTEYSNGRGFRRS